MNNKKAPKKDNSGSHGGESAKGFKITVELVAFVILAVYLVGYTISLLNKPKIGVETVTAGQIDIPRQYSGIILRDETVTYADEAGTVYFSYGENEYVKKGSVVCVIKDADSALGYEREIEALNDNILGRQALRDNPVHTEEVRRLNSKMRSETGRAVPLFMAGDNKEVYKFKSAIQKDIETRNDLLLSNSGDALTALIDKRNAFEMRLSDATSTYVANQGGVISYEIDGLESVISPANMLNITREQIESPVFSAAMGNRQVETGSPLFKIVNSNIWNMCAYFDNELTLDWEEGTNKFIYFSEAGTVDKLSMKIAAIVPDGDKTFVAFSSSKYLPDFINKRHVKFSLENDTYKGLKIPNTAIEEKTALLLPSSYIYEFRGSQGIYTKDSGGFVFKPVNVLSYNDGQAYVLQDFGSIKLDDTVYCYEDGRGVEESGYTIDKIKTVPGVYVANSGTAEFKQIEILMQNEYYAIIEKDSGTGVKPYDTIVSQAYAVDDNQIIR